MKAHLGIAGPGPRKFEVFVPGIPRPQGSKRHIGGGRLMESSKHLSGWRQTIVQYCRLPKYRLSNPLLGAVSCQLLFFIPRQKRDNGFLVPLYPPDADKLTRAVFDALQIAHIIADDSQIWEIFVRKQFAEEKIGPGCLIFLTNTLTSGQEDKNNASDHKAG